MNGIWTDLRFALRMLLRHPGTALVAILTFALGIGITTTMYGIVSGVLQDLPFEGSERLMHVETSRFSKGIESAPVSIHDFLDWRQQQESFEELVAFYLGTANLAGPEAPPQRYPAAYLTANAFLPLGMQPQLGRFFSEEDERLGAPPVVLLGHDIWQQRFAGDGEILSRQVRVNGEMHRVVGVLPPDFAFPERQSLWLPLRVDAVALERGSGPQLEVYGRLHEGQSLAAARTELDTICQRLEAAYPDTNSGLRTLVKPYIQEFIGARSPAMLKVMLGAVFGVLLIACANVANLLLARAEVRGKEIAVRSAFGAPRGRLIFQLLVEVTVWSTLGAALGLGLASMGISLFRRNIEGLEIPYWIHFQVDQRAFFFAFGAAFLASLLAGLLPALSVSAKRLGETLKGHERGTGSRRLSRFSRTLVAFQIAVSVALLAATGLMVRGTLKLQEVDFGFPAGEILTANFELFDSDYPEAVQRQAFFDSLLRGVRSLPETEVAALASALPTQHPGNWYFALEGESYSRNEDHPITRQVLVTPGFFEAFDAAPIDGRALAASDDAEHPPVAVVNRSFARRHFGSESALGRRIRFGVADSERPWRTIVGVVRDLAISGADDQQPAGVYVPLAQEDAQTLKLVLRVAGDPASLAPRVRSEVGAIDANLPLYGVDTMQQVIHKGTWSYGVFTELFVIFSLVACLLSSVGLYSLVAFSTGQRRREMGVRRALGATRRQVLSQLFRESAVQVAVGLAIGVVLALALGQAVRRLLFQVAPTDPLVLLAVVVVIAGVCALAVWRPARRAANTDPAVVLRHE